MKKQRVVALFGAVLIAAAAFAASTPMASSAATPGPSLWERLANAQPGDSAFLASGSKFRVAAYHGVQAQGVANLQLPTWTHSQEYPAGNAFTYTMVGNDPFVAQANPSVTIQSPVVPVKFMFSDGSSTDASVADPTCTPSQSAIAATLNSPVFQNVPGLGTQYVDAYQRANFNPQTNASGTNPNYHVLLQGSQAPTLTLTVPAAKGTHATLTCGGSAANEGLVDLDWLQGQLESALGGIAGAAGKFPIFVLYNTFGCDDVTALSTCGTEGIHGATTSSPVETYAFADYQLAGSSATDVEPLTHEVAEWMADPLGDNLAPTWGYIGQFSPGPGLVHCSPVLEVADPLTGTVQAISSGATTYHVPDLAFASWFYRQSPSPTPSGKYSFLGTLSSPSDGTVCPSQPGSVTATAGDGQATVSWKQLSGPSSAVDIYGVCYTTDVAAGPSNCPKTGTFAPQQIDAPTTTTVVTGLKNGTPYAFAVYAAHVLPSGALDLSTPSFFSNSVTPTGVTVPTTATPTTVKPTTITTPAPAALLRASVTPTPTATAQPVQPTFAG